MWSPPPPSLAAKAVQQQFFTQRSAPVRPLVRLPIRTPPRSEEHTSELQSHHDLVCRLLLAKKKLLAPPGSPPGSCQRSSPVWASRPFFSGCTGRAHGPDVRLGGTCAHSAAVNGAQ